MRLSRITADAVEALCFSGSPSNGNNALRTLRRMLNKAREWKIIRDVPDFKLFKEEGRRFVPMSDRAMNILLIRCADRTEGWVFPSRQKGKHITGGLVNKQWVRARKKAGLPEDLVLYCARHDFGTYVLQKTGNIAAVMNSMGHSDVKTAMTYQHPELNVVRDAINSRHILRHSAETVNSVSD